MSIYRSAEGRLQSQRLYDAQMRKLGVEFSDLYVATRFGQTHLIETGNRSGPPLLVFHGGNSTTAYNLLMGRFLLDDFHVYAVDTIGHPGKSAEVCLSAGNLDYGFWASDVIEALGFDAIRCLGGSFGGGILAKLMCAAPRKIERAVLLVPAAISNAIPLSSAKMMLPLLLYRLTRSERFLRQVALPMALSEAVLNADTLDTLKDSFDHVRTKVRMPSDIRLRDVREYAAPTLVIAAENDCLFPAGRVLPRAKRLFPGCRTHMLRGSGHLHELLPSERQMIVDFLMADRLN